MDALWNIHACCMANGQNSSVIVSGQLAIVCRISVHAVLVMVPMCCSMRPFCQWLPTAQKAKSSHFEHSYLGRLLKYRHHCLLWWAEKSSPVNQLPTGWHWRRCLDFVRARNAACGSWIWFLMTFSKRTGCANWARGFHHNRVDLEESLWYPVIYCIIHVKLTWPVVGV